MPCTADRDRHGLKHVLKTGIATWNEDASVRIIALIFIREVHESCDDYYYLWLVL